MDQFPEIRGDRTAARFAYAAAGVGGAGAATLGLMFAIEVPRNGPFVFGRINDICGGIFNLAVIPVIFQVQRHLEETRLEPTRRTKAAGWLVVGLSAAGSASSFLLVLEKLDFAPSTGISVAAIIAQAAWFLEVHRRLLKTEAYPRKLAKLGRFIGGAVLVALPMAGIGFSGQVPPWLRWSAGGTGVVLGSAAWLAWPCWYFLAGRHLSHA